MNNQSIQEKHFTGTNGYLALFANMALIAVTLYILFSGLLASVVPHGLLVAGGILAGIIIILM